MWRNKLQNVFQALVTKCWAPCLGNTLKNYGLGQRQTKGTKCGDVYFDMQCTNA